MDIKEMTTEAIKVEAYDTMVLIEKLQKNLQVTSAELKRRESIPPMVEVKKEEPSV